MLIDQLKQEFGNVSEEQLVQGCNDVLNDLLKIRNDMTTSEGKNFIEETLTKMCNLSYRMRFGRILYGINPSGLALSRSFTKNLKREMGLQWSIWNHFRKMDYDNSTLKQYVRNAKKAHQAMPQNSSLTINH